MLDQERLDILEEKEAEITMKADQIQNRELILNSQWGLFNNAIPEGGEMKIK